ncbi:hypothetical protein CLOM_g21602 [Closterium sp. NIES-68]|nr:hypothetical protein CLOM_g21602 [Closterium sp. NIES-68]GJP68635.1 hypothetical protein CLOP_g25309 [Closterium sp. NIES-67]
MKITSILILKDVEGSEPVLLASATDLSSFGYFQRGTVKEMIWFVSRTIARRTPPGRRQSVEHEEYLVHCYNRNNLVGMVFANAAYPTRSAFSVINKVLDDYVAAKGDSWMQATVDDREQHAFLEEAIAKFQDPVEADKLMKIQKELDETKFILHKTIDSVLERGEKLDTLVEKSNDLSMASQLFYQQAKKNNQCCKLV